MATLAKSSDFDYSVEKGRKDAQRQNNSDRNVRQFRDLDLYFTKASGTKDVNKVTDVQAVKRSIRNLVLLNRFEKPFSPYIFGGVVETLFEPMTQVTGILLGKQIESVIGAYEPRALLQEVNVRENFDSNEYDVQIIFTMANNPAEQVELALMLERLR